MFEYGVVLLVSGIATLIALDSYLPRVEPTSNHLLLPFVGLYGVLATGTPVFAYIGQIAPLAGPMSYALYIGVGSVLMITPLIVIEERARRKRRTRFSNPS